MEIQHQTEGSITGVSGRKSDNQKLKFN